jgi:hypothetical protein
MRRIKYWLGEFLWIMAAGMSARKGVRLKRDFPKS